MSPRSRSVALVPALAVVLVALAAVAPAALAKSSPLLKFETKGSHGYRVLVEAHGPRADIFVSRAADGAKVGSQTTYIAHRQISDGAIRADFGDLGSISMRFRPNGKVTETTPQKTCVGPDHFTIRHGTFVGKLSFRGEEGYVSVNVSKVSGELETPPFLNCIPGIAGRAGSSPAIAATAAKQPSRFRFSAGYRSGLYAAFFEATRVGRRSEFLATVLQTVGKVAIYRVAIAKGKPSQFATNDSLSFASLSPGAPFHGSGALTRDPLGARQWAGTLAVDFPGAPDTPLTGAQFKTGLTRSF